MFLFAPPSDFRFRGFPMLFSCPHPNPTVHSLKNISALYSDLPHSSTPINAKQEPSQVFDKLQVQISFFRRASREMADLGVPRPPKKSRYRIAVPKMRGGHKAEACGCPIISGLGHFLY